MWIVILKFIKPLVPYILAVLAVFLAYAYIYNKGYNAGKDDGYSKAITETRKMIKDLPACPSCPACPPSTNVQLQTFDLSKLNNKRGNFTYSPALHNVRVVIEQKDSTLVKQILRQGVK